MGTRTISSMILMLILAAPQAAVAGGKQQPPGGAEQVKQGKVLVVSGTAGGEPELTDGSGKRWLLTGDLRKELLRVHGHTVKVWGTPGPKKLMIPTLKVRAYELLKAGGMRPVVGKLLKDTRTTFWLVRTRDKLRVVPPKSIVEDLRKRINCKVWLVGKLKGTTFTPFGFGWLNCEPPKVIKPKKEKSKKETGK